MSVRLYGHLFSFRSVAYIKNVRKAFTYIVRLHISDSKFYDDYDSRSEKGTY
jgi:hypothetical protein